MSIEFTAQQVLDRVQRQFGDESGVQIISDDVIRWVNDSTREAAVQIPNFRRQTLKYDVTAGSNVIYLTMGVGSAPVAINHVYYKQDQDYVELRYLPTQQLNRLYDGWDGGTLYTGPPQVFSCENTPTNLNTPQLKLFPTPVASVVQGVKADLAVYPTEVSALNSVIDVPFYMATYVVEYCLMKAYEMDENWEAADRKAQFVQSTLNANANRTLGSQETYPVVTVRAEDEL